MSAFEGEADTGKFRNVECPLMTHSGHCRAASCAAGNPYAAGNLLLPPSEFASNDVYDWDKEWCKLFPVFDEFECSLTNLCNHTVPRASVVLSEQSRGRVPRAGIPIEQPAPIGSGGQQDPNRFSQCASKVGDTGVHGDNEIEMRYGRRCIGEVSQRLTEVNDISEFFERCRIGGADVLLQAYKRCINVQ